MKFQEQQTLWQEKYKIRFYDVDIKGKAKIQTLCHFMQEAAWNHAESIGAGFSYFIRKNLIWVLSRQLIQISRLPRWNETIILHTWMAGKDRLFFYRDFQIFDSYKNNIASATTVWFVVDLKKRRPQRTELYAGNLNLQPTKRAIDKKLTKIPSLNVPNHVRLLKVNYEDLDMNQHVNNVKYIDWILESFTLDFRKKHELKELEVDYLSEALYNDEISVGLKEKESSVFLHSIINKTNTKELCRARTVWKENTEEV